MARRPSTDLPAETVAAVRDLTAAIAHHGQEADRASRQRDELVANLLTMYGGTAVARATGLPRQRVYALAARPAAASPTDPTTREDTPT